jgi:hypothetical protein
VPNDDGIFPHQNVFNQQPYDSLALSDSKRFSSAAQAGNGDSVVSKMLKAGARVNARSTRGETALMASAVTGNRQTANSTTTVPWSFRPAAVQS